MKAVVRDKYGPPGVVELRQVPKPNPKPGEILIRVVASSVNRSDWESLTGKPMYARFGGLTKPRQPILGTDVAGVVEQTGKSVERFEVGNEVFGDLLGHGGGAFANFVSVSENAPIATKPPGLSFVEAATLPQAGMIAMQGIGKVAQSGQKVLINGAGGGTGALAIQMAKTLGADVTAVDNDRKQDFMRSLGADRVIDYQKVDYTKTGDRYNLVLDLQCERSMFAVRRAVAPGGRYLLVGGSLGALLSAAALGPLLSTKGRRIRVLGVRPTRADLLDLADRVVAGELKASIERTYPLEGVPDALFHLGEGSALGKLVVEVE